MAAYSTGGALNVKLLASYSDFNKVKCVGVGTLQVNKYCQLETVRRISISCLRQEASHFGVSVQQSWRSANTFLVKCTSSQTQSQSAGVSEETKPAIERNVKISSSEVQSLLNDICNTTSIAEFKLNLGGFHLHVKRNLNVNDMTTLPSSPPPVHIDTSNQVPDSNGSAATTSLAITKAEPSSSGIQKFLDAASDEGLIMLQSPKVGQFRRSRTIKGKRAPPPCKEKQEVKEGQVLCFIEQLGGEIPIESDVSGEVVKILKEDGEPVGYGDALIAILPSFPGIKKLQLPA